MFLTIYIQQFGWLSEQGVFPQKKKGGGGGSNHGGNYGIGGEKQQTMRKMNHLINEIHRDKNLTHQNLCLFFENTYVPSLSRIGPFLYQF